MPLDGTTISDDTRIRAAIPTLKYLCDNGAKVMLTSHLGRPKKGPEDKFRLDPIVPRLTELLGKKVRRGGRAGGRRGRGGREGPSGAALG